MHTTYGIQSAFPVKVFLNFSNVIQNDKNKQLVTKRALLFNPSMPMCQCGGCNTPPLSFICMFVSALLSKPFSLTFPDYCFNKVKISSLIQGRTIKYAILNPGLAP